MIVNETTIHQSWKTVYWKPAYVKKGGGYQMVLRYFLFTIYQKVRYHFYNLISNKDCNGAWIQSKRVKPIKTLKHLVQYWDNNKHKLDLTNKKYIKKIS